MSVTKAGFAERVFEFAFNAEYCAKNRAVLAACPYLPTQQQEKRLGYDVEFEVNQRGGGTASLFLQHKVSRHVDSRSGSNAHFYDAIGGDYFAFQLDIEQYNLIHHAANSGKESFFYCAPSFVTRAEMDKKFFASTVVDDSIWIDVKGAGKILDSQSHCIVYNADGSKVWRFSDEPKKAESKLPKDGREFARRLQKFDVESVSSIYESLYTDLKDWWPERQKVRRKTELAENHRMPNVLPPQAVVDDLGGGIAAVRELAVDYYGVSWLIGVQQ